MTERTYMNQFDINAQHPLTVPEFLLKTPWKDTSWGNDACPSFTDYTAKLQVWVDYDMLEDRVEYGGPKFCVSSIDEAGGWIRDLFFTDDVVELLKFLKLDYMAALTEASKFLATALDLAPDEEAKARIEAALDEINTEVHRGNQG